MYVYTHICVYIYVYIPHTHIYIHKRIHAIPNLLPLSSMEAGKAK